jgi:hypothetical protein
MTSNMTAVMIVMNSERMTYADNMVNTLKKTTCD